MSGNYIFVAELKINLKADTLIFNI